MTDWTAGYVADIGYTFGYYAELNPLRIKLAFLDAGLAFPEVGTACELGFGQGLAVNLHAAASVTHWSGTDFNPAQAGFAQELAQVAGTDARLFDDAFADFAQRDDLPDFDYIGLHGIWSWISDENRAIIVDFIRRKLKVGGVLYISYNTLPGWSSFAPMRQLMTEHASVMGAEGHGIVKRIDAALDFTEKLFATKPAFVRNSPQVGDRLSRIKDQNRHYLAHEYFNRDWHPMYFAKMVEWLEPAKVNFACSAHYVDHIELLNLSDEQQQFMKEIPDAMFRESVRDFMVNQQFRRDYWVKGARKLSTLEQAELMRAQKVILTTHRAGVSLKTHGALGEATMSADVYGPILDFLSDYQPKSLGQIEQEMAPRGIGFAKILQAAILLSGSGTLAAVQDKAVVLKARKQTDKLNMHIMVKARGTNEISFLASPVTGGGISVGRFPQLFLLALSQGKKLPAEWARFAWQIVSAQGQRIVKDGAPLNTPEENLAELAAQATVFANTQLPVLQALQVI